MRYTVDLGEISGESAEYSAELVIKLHGAGDELAGAIAAGDAAGAGRAARAIQSAFRRLLPCAIGQAAESRAFILISTLAWQALRGTGVPPATVYLVILEASTLDAERYPQDERWALMDAFLGRVCALTKEVGAAHYSPMVARCVSYINAHLTEPLSVGEILSALRVSRSYLSVAFKRETGRSMTEYINRERINLARFYLRRSDCSIAAAASFSGMRDANYFSRLFRRYEGMTPAEYRASCAGTGF